MSIRMWMPTMMLLISRRLILTSNNYLQRHIKRNASNSRIYDVNALYVGRNKLYI